MLLASFPRAGRVDTQEADAPRPTEHQVLVRLKAALLGPSHLRAYRRAGAMPTTSVVGEVLQVGAAVRRLRSGQEVLGQASDLGEYVLLEAERTAVRPGQLSRERSLFLPEAALALQAAELASSETELPVAVVGAEPVGLLLLLLHLGRRKTLMVETEEAVLRLAAELGATSMPADDSPASPETAPVTVFACSPEPALQRRAAELVARAGVMVFCNQPEPGGEATFDTGRMHYDQLTLRGVRRAGLAHWRRALDVLTDGNLPVDRLVSGATPLKAISVALERMDRGGAVLHIIDQ